MLRIGIGLAAAAFGAGCGSPPSEPAAQPPPAARALVGIAELEGRRYAGASGASAMAAYGLDALRVPPTDQARFLEAMGEGQPARLMEGGGAEALVFYGCLGERCRDAAAVLAIDTGTGAAFVGVRDAAGADELAPNDRLEALLRLNSPSRRWDDPASSPLDREPGLP